LFENEYSGEKPMLRLGETYLPTDGSRVFNTCFSFGKLSFGANKGFMTSRFFDEVSLGDSGGFFDEISLGDRDFFFASFSLLLFSSIYGS